MLIIFFSAASRHILSNCLYLLLICCLVFISEKKKSNYDHFLRILLQNKWKCICVLSTFKLDPPSSDKTNNIYSCSFILVPLFYIWEFRLQLKCTSFVLNINTWCPEDILLMEITRGGNQEGEMVTQQLYKSKVLEWKLYFNFFLKTLFLNYSLTTFDYPSISILIMCDVC